MSPGFAAALAAVPAPAAAAGGVALGAATGAAVGRRRRQSAATTTAGNRDGRSAGGRRRHCGGWKVIDGGDDGARAIPERDEGRETAIFKQREDHDDPSSQVAAAAWRRRCRLHALMLSPRRAAAVRAPAVHRLQTDLDGLPSGVVVSAAKAVVENGAIPHLDVDEVAAWDHVRVAPRIPQKLGRDHIALVRDVSVVRLGSGTAVVLTTGIDKPEFPRAVTAIDS